jgi:hypothetical protein
MSKSLSDERKKEAPTYILFSEAVHMTSRRMWGGVPVVDRPRRFDGRKLPRAAESRRVVKAAQALTTAIEGGKLRIYLAPQGASAEQVDVADVMPLPKEIVRKLIKPNAHLTDYPYRPTLKLVDGDTKLYRKFLRGRFVLDRDEFDEWHGKESGKGLWPSQKEKLTRRRDRGRRSKQTTSLEDAVQQLVKDSQWTAKDGAPALQRMLIAQGHQNVPSPRTLLRLVERLAMQTRHSGLRRKKRTRRSKSSARPESAASNHPARHRPKVMT